MPFQVMASNGHAENEVCDPYRIDPDNGDYANSSQNVYLNFNSSLGWFYESNIGSSGYLTKIASKPDDITEAHITAIVEVVGDPVDLSIGMVSDNVSIPVDIVRLYPDFGRYLLGYEISQADITRLSGSRGEILITYSWVPTTQNAQIKVDFTSLLICYRPLSERFKLFLSQLMTPNR